MRGKFSGCTAFVAALIRHFTAFKYAITRDFLCVPVIRQSAPLSRCGAYRPGDPS